MYSINTNKNVHFTFFKLVLIKNFNYTYENITKKRYLKLMAQQIQDAVKKIVVISFFSVSLISNFYIFIELRRQ